MVKGQTGVAGDFSIGPITHLCGTYYLLGCFFVCYAHIPWYYYYDSSEVVTVSVIESQVGIALCLVIRGSPVDTYDGRHYFSLSVH